MKQMAACDFEDLLQVRFGVNTFTFAYAHHVAGYQCAIPCFDGLLPGRHNQDIVKLLYRFAEWHALAKLRMHRECTLNLLDNLTQELGGLIRHFRDSTSRDFSTVELPQESIARRRHQVSNQQNSTLTTPASSSNGRRVKVLNLTSVKFHFMGDYTTHIRNLAQLILTPRNW